MPNSRRLPRSVAVLSMSAALWAPVALAATASGASPSPFGGNGHNVSFDGRIFIAARGDGWNAQVLRPGLVSRDGAGWPDVAAAFSDSRLIQPTESCENAIAICEPDAASTPYACNDAGAADLAGAFACYDVVVFDSNACVPENPLRRRPLHLRVAEPNTNAARIVDHAWGSDRVLLASRAGATLRGIEPSVTRDGRLLVWQGHPDNDGKIDIVMYATSDSACSLTGWDGPHNLSHMVNDPRVNGRYRLGERVLRAASGEIYEDERRVGGFVVDDGDMLRGGYPWVFPDGDAISFTAANMPCRSENDPAGCGPRRSAVSVIGYPTNWGLAHVDGPINPDTDNTVRLFFSSPGPHTFAELPATAGLDVWPFFGSNTSNYTELVFDDGLDGNYAGVWLFNESVNKDGNLDRTRTPDTSGYFNTGLVEGAVFPLRNEGPRGKTLAFNGTGGRVRVPHDVSLAPQTALTLEMILRPDVAGDCDANNNWRVLATKGHPIEGAFSLLLEESQHLHARVKAGGVVRSVVSPLPIPLGVFSTVAVAYQSATGLLSLAVDGVIVAEVTGTPGRLDSDPGDLFIGSRGPRAACPDGDGAFAGHIEEVRLSTIDRLHAPPVSNEGEGETEPGEGETEPGEGETEPGEGEEGEGISTPPPDDVDIVVPPPESDGCAASRPGAGFALLALLALLPARRRRAR